MSYQVVWEPEALAQAAKLAADDPEGVRQVFTAVDRLRPRGLTAPSAARRPAAHPRWCLPSSVEISDQQVRVSVIHLGRMRCPSWPSPADLEVVVVAVRPADSRQGTAQRYATALRDGLPARFATAGGA